MGTKKKSSGKKTAAASDDRKEPAAKVDSLSLRIVFQGHATGISEGSTGSTACTPDKVFMSPADMRSLGTMIGHMVQLESKYCVPLV